MFTEFSIHLIMTQKYKNCYVDEIPVRKTWKERYWYGVTGNTLEIIKKKRGYVGLGAI